MEDGLIAETSLPARLHHTGYVVKDLERTRAFYEDVIGLPLIGTYIEEDEIFGARRRYCHCFFGLADGGALAFFQFVDEADATAFAQRAVSPFTHIAFKASAEVQAAIRDRLSAAGRSTRLIDHGYCLSLYVTDPDGMNIEFTVDSDRVDPNAPTYTRAHEELARFLSGDATPNNALRNQ